MQVNPKATIDDLDKPEEAEQEAVPVKLAYVKLDTIF